MRAFPSEFHEWMNRLRTLRFNVLMNQVKSNWDCSIFVRTVTATLCHADRLVIAHIYIIYLHLHWRRLFLGWPRPSRQSVISFSVQIHTSLRCITIGKLSKLPIHCFSVLFSSVIFVSLRSTGLAVTSFHASMSKYTHWLSFRFYTSTFTRLSLSLSIPFFSRSLDV